MGMFDYVLVEYELPDADAARVTEWQTKTLDAPFMLKYRITKDGRLLRECVHYEDRSDRNAPTGSFASFAGAMTPVHEGWDDIAFHGVLNFYGSLGNEWRGDWVEYDATFTDGTLTRVQRVPAPANQREADPILADERAVYDEEIL